MRKNQDEIDNTHIEQVAEKFGDAMESGDMAALLECFNEDCEIELLGLKLHGHKGVKKWYEWTGQHMKQMQFDKTSSAINGNLYFQEFTLNGIIHNGKKVTSKQSRVLEFEDGKVKKFRLYLDRLQFAESVVNDFASKIIVGKFIDVSVKGMK